MKNKFKFVILFKFMVVIQPLTYILSVLKEGAGYSII